jgi:hypothetical protein
MGMAFLLRSGLQCNVVFWKTGNRCVRLPAIMEWLMKLSVAFCLPVAKKTSDKISSRIHVGNVFGGNLAG